MDDSNSGKKIFTNISPKSWEHPADRAAMITLKQFPEINNVFKFFISLTTEKAIRLIFLASSVKVTENQFPLIHKLTREACEILDYKDIPEVYVSQNPVMNAGTIGVKKPFIYLNSSLIGSYSEKELLTIIGHEVGHVMSGHSLYKTILWFLLNLSMTLVNIPFSSLVLYGVIAALREWDRKSELSADRAGLLVSQDVETSYAVLMKMAGGNNPDEMHLNEFIEQASEYEKNGDILDSVYKVLNLFTQTHPFPVIRVKELKSWYDSGGFSSIMDGTYLNRDDEKDDDILGEFKKAKTQYESDIHNSEDPLNQVFSSIGKGLENAGKGVEDIINKIFKDD